jgi:hypothetical protein
MAAFNGPFSSSRKVVCWAGEHCMRRIQWPRILCMQRTPSTDECRLERTVLKMELATQVELSPNDLVTMRRLTKALQDCLRLVDIALTNNQTKRKHRSSSEAREDVAA